jgi:outer membrane protein OmpA-like peptidoglycan-associated protein
MKMINRYRKLFVALLLVVASSFSCASQQSPAPAIGEPPKPDIKTYKVPPISQAKHLDEDGDGVQNYQDKCPHTLKGDPVDKNGCPNTIIIETEKLYRNINFGYNKCNLKTSAYPTLDQIIASLKVQPEIDIEVQGHTDSSGNSLYNKKLSLKRAKAVKAYLVGKGIDPARIYTNGYGSERPVASNKSEKGRALNRRVETLPII